MAVWYYAIIIGIITVTCGVTIGPADPALQGGTKLLENVGHFSENLTVVLAKVRVLG